MAYFRKVKNGWRAEIRKKGLPGRSMTFGTKAEAQAWAARQEAEIVAGKTGQYPDKTLRDAFDRYECEVSRKKRGGRAEALRFAAVIRDFPWLAEKVLHTITTADLARWRDARLQHVSGASVLREVAQLRNVWSVARDEWLWCGDSPWTKLGLPDKGKARDRMAKWQEMRRLLRRVGWTTECLPVTPQLEVGFAWLVAHYTSLRAGEILGLRVSTVDLERRVIRLDRHKTDRDVGVRLVPFFPRALPLLRRMVDHAKAQGRDELFTISSQSLDVLFRKYRDSVLIEGLHFHDSRASALTWMSRRVDVMTLAKISGHRDINILQEHYYRVTAAQIAARLE